MKKTRVNIPQKQSDGSDDLRLEIFAATMTRIPDDIISYIL